MADKTDTQRLTDLKAALRKAKPGARLALADCAALWGVTKPRFVNKRAEMADFPDPVAVEGNAHFYDAKAVIRAMIAHLERHRAVSTSRAKRLGALIGAGDVADAMGGGISIAELARASQLAAEIEARMRAQGQLVAVHDLQRVVGMVFSEVSEFLSNLSNIIDPHGRLAPDVRAAVDSNGHEQLLAMHARLKGMLSPADVVTRPPRKPAPKPRKARAPSKRKPKHPRAA